MSLLKPRIVIFLTSTIALATMLSSTLAPAQQPPPRIEHVKRMANSGNPELLYWFISPNELQNSMYQRDLDLVSDSGTFDFIFLTARENTSFYDFDAMHPIFKDLVQRAHSRGIKVGLQLWAREKDIPDDQLQGIVVENEATLDASGSRHLRADSQGVRMAGDHPLYAPARSQLLHAWAFTKTAEGEYKPGSVTDVTRWVKANPRDPASVDIQISAPSALAGQTVYVTTVHYQRFPDLFSPFLSSRFAEALRAYKDVGFDGAALDEFRYMTIGKPATGIFRERLYSKAMAAFFTQRSGRDLVRTLFEMRYAPAGMPQVRAAAINRYFDLLPQGPLRVEKEFAQATTRIFGPKAFHGIHDTFHNRLDTDEIWQTGINWWSIPRDYGQSDEHTPMTTRLGIGMANRKPVEYNQYYTKDRRDMLAETMQDARYNVRVHYHALNDNHGWGLDLRDPQLLQGIGLVEDKVRLLNRFAAPRPATNVLYLFGMPALANWMQADGHRNEWDINGNLKAEEKAVAGWNAGYIGPFAPSTLVDEGRITSDGKGGLLFGGQRFTAVVFIGPEFSKESTLRVLEDFVKGGGKLLLDGAASRDFQGNQVTQRFAKLAHAAVGTTFSVDAMKELGVPRLTLEDGAVYEDGSVVLTDLDSLMNHSPKSFSVYIQGHTFTGSYCGLLALKSDRDGHIQKLAGGALSELKRDGKVAVRLSTPADVVLLRDTNGTYSGTVVGDASVDIR